MERVISKDCFGSSIEISFFGMDFVRLVKYRCLVELFWCGIYKVKLMGWGYYCIYFVVFGDRNLDKIYVLIIFKC